LPGIFHGSIGDFHLGFSVAVFFPRTHLRRDIVSRVKCMRAVDAANAIWFQSFHDVSPRSAGMIQSFDEIMNFVMARPTNYNQIANQIF